MVSVKWFNEKGNVSVKVRDGVRSQVKTEFEKALKNQFTEIEPNANGGFSVAVATNESTGEPIYAHFEFKVNDKNPKDIGDKKKGKTVSKTETVVPDLFGNVDNE